MSAERRARICAMNDRLRRDHIGGRIFLSRGLMAMGTVSISEAIDLIASIDKFDERNDPYGEHDFGSVVVDGRRLFWKIDYYDASLTTQAVDPADETQAFRILTIMLAEEY